MRRLLALLLLAALAPAAPSARADEPAGTTVVVDWPGNGAAVTSPVTLVGWALSGEGSRGTGIDAISVYLDGPADAGTALGRATYGQTRPDVAVARGDVRYAVGADRRGTSGHSTARKQCHGLRAVQRAAGTWLT